MSFQLQCACGKTLLLKDEWAGRKVRCSRCKKVTLATQPEVPSAEEDVPELDVTEVAMTRAPNTEFEDDRRPSRKRPRDDEEGEDDRPRSRSRRRDEEDEDEDDRPRSRSRRRDEEDEGEDDRPRSRSRRRDEEDEDEHDRPRRKRKRSDDDYDDDPPRPRRRDRARAGGQSNTTANASIGTGVLMMVGAVVWFVGGLFADIIFFYPPVLFILGIAVVFRGATQRQ